MLMPMRPRVMIRAVLQSLRQRCVLVALTGKILIFEPHTYRVIDYLHRSTGTQYFVCEMRLTRYTRGADTNVWWAWTQGDEYGRWGWVPEVYFQGGLNDEPDAGLPTC